VLQICDRGTIHVTHNKNIRLNMQLSAEGISLQAYLDPGENTAFKQFPSISQNCIWLINMKSCEAY
jgi:hypothetical protein